MRDNSFLSYLMANRNRSEHAMAPTVTAVVLALMLVVTLVVVGRGDTSARHGDAAVPDRRQAVEEPHLDGAFYPEERVDEAPASSEAWLPIAFAGTGGLAITALMFAGFTVWNRRQPDPGEADPTR